LQLIDELPPSPLVAGLRKSLKQRRQQRLADIRAAVAGQSLLKLCDGRTGTSRTRQSSTG
jgi:hypothetical protein